MINEITNRYVATQRILKKKINFYAIKTESIDLSYNDTFILHHL